MAEKNVLVPGPGGTFKEGMDVPISESLERSSEITLEDGSTIRVKFSVLQVIRVNGEFDPDGNPKYVVKGTPLISTVYVADALRKK